jgi:valyl-tRNA synthetase
MSKTKGNVVDPIEIVKQYGTDAVRFTLASMASPGTDIAFNVARTEGYRAFANKIWNAARFIFMNVDRAAEVGIKVDPSVLGSMPTIAADAPLEARWIVAELHATAAKVNESLENYRYDDAANVIYQFFWGDFCDWYLEIVKLRLDFSENADKVATKAALTTLVQVFEVALRLLSPFMPFLTEELWHAIYVGNPPAKSVALAEYPRATSKMLASSEPGKGETKKDSDISLVQNLISLSRFKRREQSVPDKENVPLSVHGTDRAIELFKENEETISKLARVSPIRYSKDELKGQGVFQYFHHFQFRVEYEATIDPAAERERLTKDIAKYEKGVAAAERQLSNESFLAKAPPQVVEGLKKQETETRLLLEKARAALDGLSR